MIKLMRAWWERQMLAAYKVAHTDAMRRVQETVNQLIREQHVAAVRLQAGLTSEITQLRAKAQSDAEEMGYALAVIRSVATSNHRCNHEGEPCPIAACKSFLIERSI